MAEQITTVEEMNNEQYIDAIEELKANTVSRDAYNSLRNENKKLLDALVSGQQITQEATEPKVSADELRTRLASGNLNNLEYVETALSLRDVLIGNGERDPFLPVGEKGDTTQEAIDGANSTAEGLRQLVDMAEGDSGVFSALYQKYTKSDGIPRRR